MPHTDEPAGRDDLNPEELRALAGNDAAGVIDEWPSQRREAAVKTVQRYGRPSGVAPGRLVWTGAAPWRRDIVNRDTVPHRFPKPHNDLLEESIAYRVPPDRLDDVALKGRR
jgi:hypothetical protein